MGYISLIKPTTKEFEILLIPNVLSKHFDLKCSHYKGSHRYYTYSMLTFVDKWLLREKKWGSEITGKKEDKFNKCLNISKDIEAKI